MCIATSRLGMWFWGSWPRGAKCVKDGKVYDDKVPESELGFKHLTEHEDMVVLQDSHSLLR